MNKSWKALQKGDIVDVIAPAYRVNEEELGKSLNYIKSLGLEPRIPSDIIGDDLFSSSSAEVRLRHLEDALYNNISKAIWPIKGGYGTAEIIEMLDGNAMPQYTKLVIGFSDITALHIFLNQRWGWSTIHGEMPHYIANGFVSKESEKKLLDIIFGRSNTQEFTLEPLNEITPDCGNTTTIAGGNLTIIQNSIGTNWQIETEGKFLLLEEVDEIPYRIDRSLLHMKQAGLFDNIDGIIFGDFTGNIIKVDQILLDKVLERFAKNIEIPVFRSRGIGHDKVSNPVPLGTKAIIEKLGSGYKLICENGSNNSY